jgi:nitrite reductase (NADH) small subunit
LPPGSVMEVTIGKNVYAICNAGGRIFAVSGVCPHAGGPLGHGALHDHMLVCPWHAWEYDCRSGENDFDPSICLETFTTKVEGDDILIDISKDARAS